MSATTIFDPLKARIIEEDATKTLHLKKKLPGLILHFPGEDRRTLHSSMLRVYEDSGKTTPIGFGLLAFEETKDFAGLTVDLYLNYNLPVRLDLENGGSKILSLLYDVKKPYDFATLNCVLDNGNAMDTICPSMVLEFAIGKESIQE